jgi:hypothetical protein
MAADTNRCAMDGCMCTVQSGQKYCSAYCQTAKSTSKLQCDCGHPACEGHKHEFAAGFLVREMHPSRGSSIYFATSAGFLCLF